MRRSEDPKFDFNIKSDIRQDCVDGGKICSMSDKNSREMENFSKKDNSAVISTDLRSSENFKTVSRHSINLKIDHQKTSSSSEMEYCEYSLKAMEAEMEYCDKTKEFSEYSLKAMEAEIKEVECNESTYPAIVIPCRGSGAICQRVDELPKDGEKMSRIGKLRVNKKEKDPIKMKIKMKKLPIKELGVLNHGDDNVIGGIFRLHVCNQQEGKRLEKLKKKKKCKIHKIPLLSGAEDDDVPEEWFDKKLWNTLCHYPHLGSHAREDYYRRIIKWRKGYSSDTNTGECILCEIQQLASKPLYKDIDTMHYSHDFYEMFSRKPRNAASSAVPDDVVEQGQLFLKNRTPPPAPPTSSLGSTPSSPLPRMYSNIVSPCKMNRVTPEILRVPSHKSSPDPEYTVSRANDLQALYVPKFKCIHQQCSPRLPPVQWALAKPPNYLDFVHKRTAFKAYTRKKETNAKKGNLPPKQKFAVKELGVTYFLPDRNQNLAKRHVSIPKSYTYIPQPPPKDQLISTWIPPYGKSQIRQIVS